MSIGRNTSWLFFGRLIAQLVQFALTLVVARGLGEAGLGQYSLITAALALANTLATWGTDTLLIRAVARRQTVDAPLAMAALFVQTGWSIAILAAVGLAQHWWPLPAGTIPYLFLLFPLALTSISTAQWRGMEQMSRWVGWQLGTAVAQLLLGAAVLAAGGGLPHLLVALGLVQSGAAIIAYGWPPRWPLVRIKRAQLAAVWRAGWVLALLMATAVVQQRLPLFALAGWGTEADVGQFSAAARLVEGIKLLPYALFGALFPAVVRSGRLDMGRTWLLALLGGMALIAVGGGWLGRWLLPWLYGAAYQPSAAVWGRLLWGLLPFVLHQHLALRLVAAGHEKRALVATAASLLASLLLYATWLPTHPTLPMAATLAVASDLLLAWGLFAVSRKL
ncbi:MAG: oligosaccharide flippase family protein [Chloroflexi bacterium]|nr:oligosaccharide flippase family protein [Chloroflexota bacterium]